MKVKIQEEVRIVEEIQEEVRIVEEIQEEVRIVEEEVRIVEEEELKKELSYDPNQYIELLLLVYYHS